MYEVVITQHAKRNLAELKRHGKAILKQLHGVLENLKSDPYGTTQELHAPLQGYRSLHSGRFRAIVRIVEKKVHVVYVVGVGWHESGSRNDVYAQVERAIRAGVIKLTPPSE
jgi:mRNA-degrading endonuclease RelE of RelBE toxin-antitoxin system